MQSNRPWKWQHNDEHLYEAEVYRLKGELLLAQSVPDYPQAEICFGQALDIARQQQATAWELRAAMSLGRLQRKQGKGGNAWASLAVVYGKFTDGLETADCREAKALLEMS